MQKGGYRMIYITGDTHIPYDVTKLTTKAFPEQKKLTKNDYVLICGDFGGVWTGPGGSDDFWLRWFKRKRFTTLFVDGNHENFSLLNQYPVELWNGGKVHRVTDHVIHLMRGQLFTWMAAKSSPWARRLRGCGIPDRGRLLVAGGNAECGRIRGGDAHPDGRTVCGRLRRHAYGAASDRQPIPQAAERRTLQPFFRGD